MDLCGGVYEQGMGTERKGQAKGRSAALAFHARSPNLDRMDWPQDGSAGRFEGALGCWPDVTRLIGLRCYHYF